MAKLRIHLFADEVQLFRFVSGSACTSLIVFLLLTAGSAKVFTLCLLGAVLIVWAWFTAVPSPKPFPALNIARRSKWLIIAGLCVYASLYLTNALGPETSPDGMAYHLALVKQYLSQRSFGHITDNMYATFPAALEMLFLMAFSIGRHSAATLVEFAFLITLPLLILSYARRFGYGPAGLAAAVLVFLSPIFAVDGTDAYNDVAGTCVVFCVFYLLRVWEAEKKAALLVLVGVLAGFSYGIKYPLLLTVPYAIAIVLWNLWARPRSALKAASVIAVVAAVMILPWMIKNWITVDNPFAPFLNRFFPNPYFTLFFENSYLEFVRTAPGAPGFYRLWDNVVRGGYTAGLLGPIFLLTPLSLWALRCEEGRKLLLGLAVFSLPAISNHDTRFAMPFIPFAALALTLVLSKIPLALPAVVTAAFVLSWPSVINLYAHPGGWRLVNWNVRDALRLDPEPVILRRRLGAEYDVIKLIETKVPKIGRIYIFGGDHPNSYINRQLVIYFESAYGEKLWQMLWRPIIKEWIPSARMKFSFPAHPIRRLRVQEIAGGTEQWSLAEFHIFNGKQELSRSSDWRLQAKPNPWDVRLAFDANPVTLWSSARAIQKGMWVAVDMGQPRLVDSVVLDCAHNQSQVHVILQEETAPGTWNTIADSPALYDEKIPWNLRRAATQEAKRMGITHLLIQDSANGARDFEREPARWGISLLGQAAGSTLYSIW